MIKVQCLNPLMSAKEMCYSIPKQYSIRSCNRGVPGQFLVHVHLHSTAAFVNAQSVSDQQV